MCNSGNNVAFNRDQCMVTNGNGTRLFVANRRGNLYKIDMSELSDQKVSCLMTLKEDHWLWHRKCGHTSLELLSKLQKYSLVRGLPNMSFKDNLLCESCVKGKQVKSSFKSKDEVSTQRPLELIHLDLFGPTRTASISGKRYGLVIVDDYSRWTWVNFLNHKDESFKVFCKFLNQVQNEKGISIIAIRSDHGREFENENFRVFCENNGINHNFSTSRTPQQNGIVERKNRSLQEMARTMLNANSTPKHFWAEAINTACYLQNRIYIRPLIKKTPYELWKNKKTNISYFHPFGVIMFHSE